MCLLCLLWLKCLLWLVQFVAAYVEDAIEARAVVFKRELCA